MLFEIIFSLILGILFGTLTGLIPGIHINLVGVFLISLASTVLYSTNPVYLTTFVVAMAITHTFLDFIPSIFLGCPDTDTELSLLPGHELLKKGLGYEAIILTAYGSIAAILLLIILAFPSIFLISKIAGTTEKILPFLLIGISIILISLEKNKFQALSVFLLTGFLGLIVLNLETLNEPLFPLLTGLFGSSMLILSIKNKTKIPKQKITKPKIKNHLKKPLIGSIISSPLCSFLPGLGSGQAAVIGNTLTKNTDKKSFLVLLGATNTLVMGFSFISLYCISKTRTGAAVAIKEILGIPSAKILSLIMIITFFTGIISFFLTIKISKFFTKNIHKINYTKLSIGTLIFLGILILAISNVLGFIVFITSTFTGLYCISLKIKRTNMMGCLLVPTIILYLL